jgi:alpha-glucosidase
MVRTETMIRSLVLLAVVCIAAAQNDPDKWWKSANIYQISPVSFKDSNNDGYGDIQGIISKLDHLVDTGVDVIFLSPFYKTPFKDFGYDISNYIEIDARFGSMTDVEELFTKAKQKGLKVIIDFVPNHTSNEHDWFVKSENRERGYENFYVWHDGIPTMNDGRPRPPNDWESVYGGSSWEWSQKREQYYYHGFAVEQPDLNLREQRVIDELNKVLDFWLDKNADGFRIDAVSQLFEDPAFLNNPDQMHDLPQTYELVENWRRHLDDYKTKKGGDSRILVPQVWDSNLEALMKYYGAVNTTNRAQVPTNFKLINELGQRSKAADYKKVIDEYLGALPVGAVANWFVSTPSIRLS